MSCYLCWVILEERLSVRVLASAAVDDSSTALAVVVTPLGVVNNNSDFSEDIVTP